MLQQKFGVILCSLTLSALSTSLFAKPWNSGEIVSRETFLYGAFETRMQTSRGSGAITAFFLLKENSWIPGAEWQELDFEIFGKSDGYSFQTQIMTPGDPRTQNLQEHSTSQSLHDSFHVYRIEWAPDYLAFYLDGKLLRRETDTQVYAKFFDSNRVAPMSLRMSLWAGFSDWSGQVDASQAPSPVTVDWIRYYSYDQKTGSFDLKWDDPFTDFDNNRWQKADWTFEYAVNNFKPDNAYTEDGKLKLLFNAD